MMNDVEANGSYREYEEPKPGFLADLFEVDIRSLAIFRVAIGLLILADLGNRLPILEMFYTDEGILPRELAQAYLGEGFWSLYWIDGSLAFTRVLFAFTAISAIAFTVGFNTRLMNVICLILVSSLQVSNPLVLTGGHIEMRLLLFWSMFLPLGAVWSVDSRLDRERPPVTYRLTSVATMAILLQVASIYFLSGIAKLNEDWYSGRAVEIVLGLEMFVKPMGETLRQYPGFLKFVTYATLVTELIGPVLMFLPKINKFSRGMMMAIFWSMHIAIWLTMSIGIFSLMAMAAWLVFVPYQFWAIWNRHQAEPPSTMSFAQTLPQLFGSILCAAALVYVVLLSVANFNKANSTWFTQDMRRIGNATLIVQEFRLFGRPPADSPMFEYQAKLTDETEVDIFKEMMAKSNNPDASVYQYFSTQHWRRIHSNLLAEPNQPPTDVVNRIRDRLLEQIVHRWNQHHDENQAIATAALNCYLRSIELNQQWGEPRKEVWATWSKDTTTE